LAPMFSTGSSSSTCEWGAGLAGSDTRVG
jgi:hypothetical protein